MRKMILLTLSLLLLAGQGWGADVNYYISDTTDAAEDGTLAHPFDAFSDLNWTTINNAVTAGSTVYINLNKGDTWTGATFTFGGSGAAGRPITLRAYGTGNAPIVDANDAVAYPAYATGKSYVTIDGIHLRNAQNQNVLFTGAGSNGIITNFTSDDTLATVTRGVNILTQTDTTISNGTITNVSTNGIELGAATTGTIDTVTITNAGADGVLMAASVGAWTVNDLTVNGAGSEGINAAASAAGTITINDPIISNTTHEGMDMRMGTASLIISGGTITDTTLYGLYLVGTGAATIDIDDTVIGGATNGAGRDGIYITGVTGPVTIDGVSVTYTLDADASGDGNGIYFTGAATVDATSAIRNITLNNNAENGYCINGGKGLPIYDSTVNDNAEDGVHINAAATDTRVERCWIEGNGTAGVAGAGDGITSHDNAANIIGCYNVITDNKKAGLAAITSGNTGNLFYGNTLYNNQWEGELEKGEINLTGTVAWTLKNNIVVNTDGHLLIDVDTYANITAATNNVYYGTAANNYCFQVGDYDPDGAGARAAGSAMTFAEYKAGGIAAGNANFESGSIFADPKFVNADGGDFRLRGGSPAIGIGTTDPTGDGTPDTITGINGVVALSGCVTPGAYQGRLHVYPFGIRRWWCPE